MTRTLRFILTIALALTSLAALLAAGPLLTYSAERTQWIVRPMPKVAGAPEGPSKWSVAARDGKQIVDFASVGRAPAQLANFGDRLAILAGDGTWSLVSRDGVVAGTTLPDGRLPLAIASGRGLLWFLSGHGDGRTLTTWDGRSFADAGPVPDVRPPAVDARLLVTRGGVFVASRLIDGVQLVAQDEGKWNAPVAPIAADAAWLVQDERRGPLMISRSGGDWSIRPIARDGTPGTATPLPAGGEVPRDASASIVDGDVRLAWADGEQIVEQSFSPANQPVGPPTRVRPTSAANARAPSAFDRAASWLSMLAMAVLLMTAGRSRGEPEKRAAGDVTPTPASLGRRLAAGLIDAWPLYAACAYVVLTSDRPEAELVRLDAPRDRLIVLAGSLAYVIVAFACEWRWQRTLGKLLFGLRVVVEATGARPSVRAILIRNALRLLDLNLVTLLIVPLSRQRQRLGDLVAGTIVVNAHADRAADADAPTEADGTEPKR